MTRPSVHMEIMRTILEAPPMGLTGGEIRHRLGFAPGTSLYSPIDTLATHHLIFSRRDWRGFVYWRLTGLGRAVAQHVQEEDERAPED